LVLLAALWLIVQKTKIGTAMRAVSFNHHQAAALMGVSINRVISSPSAWAPLSRRLRGILYALKAPGIEPLMGVQPGLRAFIAAVLGGIGNLPGAALADGARLARNVRGRNAGYLELSRRNRFCDPDSHFAVQHRRTAR